MKVNKRRAIFGFILCGFIALSFIGCSDKEQSRENYVRAIEAFEKQDFEKSILYCKKAIKKDKVFFEAKLLEAKNLFFTARYEESKKIFKALLKKYPNYTDAKLYQVRTLIALKEYKEAENLLKAEMKFNSTDYRFYYLYSVLYSNTDQQDKRLFMCRKAEQMLDEAKLLQLELCELYMVLGLYKKADECLKKAEVLSTEPKEIKDLRLALKQGGAL